MGVSGGFFRVFSWLVRIVRGRTCDRGVAWGGGRTRQRRLHPPPHFRLPVRHQRRRQHIGVVAPEPRAGLGDHGVVFPIGAVAEVVRLLPGVAQRVRPDAELLRHLPRRVARGERAGRPRPHAVGGTGARHQPPLRCPDGGRAGDGVRTEIRQPPPPLAVPGLRTGHARVVVAEGDLGEGLEEAECRQPLRTVAGNGAGAAAQAGGDGHGWMLRSKETYPITERARMQHGLRNSCGDRGGLLSLWGPWGRARDPPPRSGPYRRSSSTRLITSRMRTRRVRSFSGIPHSPFSCGGGAAHPPPDHGRESTCV